MVGLLWRDVVEYILFGRFIEIIGQLFLQSHKLFNGVIEHDRVKEMPIEMFGFVRLGISIVSTVAQESEIGKCDARDFFEYLIWDDCVEGLQRHGIAAIGHQERWNRARKTTKVVTDTVLDIILLFFFLLSLDSFHDSFAGRLNKSIHRVCQLLLESIYCLCLFLGKRFLDSRMFIFCGLFKLLLPFVFQSSLFDLEMSVCFTYNLVALLGQLLFKTLRFRFLQVAHVFLVGSLDDWRNSFVMKQFF